MWRRREHCNRGLLCIHVDPEPDVLGCIFIAPNAIVFIALTGRIRNHSVKARQILIDLVDRNIEEIEEILEEHEQRTP
jgi:hypothetical protein